MKILVHSVKNFILFYFNYTVDHSILFVQSYSFVCLYLVCFLMIILLSVHHQICKLNEAEISTISLQSVSFHAFSTIFQPFCSSETHTWLSKLVNKIRTYHTN